MKRLTFCLLMVLLLGFGPILAVESVTQSKARITDSSTGAVTAQTVHVAWVAHTDGTLTATALTDAIAGDIRGWYLIGVETNPGDVAPTDNYDITLTDSGGADVMGGQLLNRDTANTELAFPAHASPLITTSLVITLTNNSVNSATGSILIFFAREPLPGAVQAVVTATDLDIRDLVNATDSVAIYGSDGTQRIIKTDSGGAVQVDIESLPNVTIETFPDNEPINIAQINGVTTLMGNGVTGTGSPRVTIASDNTPFPIKIDQTTPGTTNKVTSDITFIGGSALAFGQAAMASSLPVAIASNQTPLPLPPTIDVTVTPAITNVIYAAGDSLGGELTFASVVRNAGGGGTIMGVVVTILADAKPSTSFDLIFFQANPATAVLDHDPLDIVDADMDDICGRVQIRSTDYTALSDNEFAVKAGIGMPFDLDSGSDLYCYVLINDADTFDSVADVIIKLVVAPD